MTGWENSGVALTVSGKYQNKEKPLKLQRRLGLVLTLRKITTNKQTFETITLILIKFVCKLMIPSNERYTYRLLILTGFSV